MSETSEQRDTIIVRCSRCNGWLASTNPRFIDGHLANCSSEGDGERDREVVQGEHHRYMLKVRRESRIEHSQMVRCIAEIDGIRTKVIASHIRRGKFVVLSTSVYEYRYLVGRVIDASDICAILL
ncbi:MAG: hypothetical protein RMJ59_06600 [Candidatus Nitrosocaldus sp.]|nr:hypothetical protein [Candidatus Nitrosocaldus sp.]MCS7140586.1 hypothetical protein [Candidatus Nitrosocaldus sp.]MDW7999600.1 hypothetical protein [Candidatus Nitrosocaldus sp.]MDW8276029.1 hypothetical protein [Candidatus Nitrosocaldus sp.]